MQGDQQEETVPKVVVLPSDSPHGQKEDLYDVVILMESHYCLP